MSTCDVKSEERADNRRKFPYAASVLDDLREHFGVGVKLTWAQENGAEIGRPISAEFCVLTPHEKASAIKKRMKS